MCQRLDRRGRTHVELFPPLTGEIREFGGIEVGRDHTCPFDAKRFADGAPDPLPGCRYERELALKSVGQRCRSTSMKADWLKLE